MENFNMTEEELKNMLKNSRYSLKSIDENNYLNFKITKETIDNDNTTTNLIDENGNEFILSPYVYVPYLIVESDERNTEAEDFKKDYNNKHKLCPKCKSENCTQTLVGYILDMSKKEEYKDKNICVCCDCEDAHTVHERVNF